MISLIILVTMLCLLVIFDIWQRSMHRRQPEIFSFRLRDHCANRHNQYVTGRVVQNYDSHLYIYVDGYGEHDDPAGPPLILEYWDGQLRTVMTTDIRSQEPTVVSLEGANETLAPPWCDDCGADWPDPNSNCPGCGCPPSTVPDHSIPD